MKNLSELEEKLNIEFEDKELLKRAFTHRSYINESNDANKHNERLEYLGDAVLEFLASRYLFEKYPEHPEGDLTSFRSATVKTETLADTARKLDFGKYLRMSRGEETTGGRDKDYLLANTFEAILGAIYMDKGLDACDEFVKRILFPRIPNIVENRLDLDAKTQFQEIAQEMHKITPSYRVIAETGPDHNKRFEVEVSLNDKPYGKGKGPSKQKAEENAAEMALIKIEKEKAKNKTATTA